MGAIAITTAVTATVSALVGTIVAAVLTTIKNKGHESLDGSKAMRDGMRALLWRELKNIHAEAMEQGMLDCEERRHLENVYEAYHGIGGNGTGTRLFEEAMKTRVENE